MFPLSNFVYLFSFMFVFSMSIETTDDCGQDPYETGCLVETFPGLIKIKDYYQVKTPRKLWCYIFLSRKCQI